MGNCLVTKLKGTVNNDNLSKVGEFLVGFYDGIEGNTFAIGMGHSADADVSCRLFDCTFNGANVVALPANGSRIQLTITGDNPRAFIQGKYDINLINSNGLVLNLDDLKYCKASAMALYNCQLSGDISSITELVGYHNSMYPQDLILSGNLDAVKGDLSMLGSKYLKSITIEGLINVHGSLNNLGKSAETLTSVSLPRTKNVRLDIVEFVKTARAAGVQEKQSKINFTGSNICYVSVGDVVIDTTRVELTWTSNTITYNGTTITA